MCSILGETFTWYDSLSFHSFPCMAVYFERYSGFKIIAEKWMVNPVRLEMSVFINSAQPRQSWGAGRRVKCQQRGVAGG